MGEKGLQIRAFAPAWCVVGLAYYCAAAASLYLTEGIGGTATLWPASGILVAALLLTGTRHYGWILGSVTIASFAANWQFGIGAFEAVIFTIANLAEGLIVSQLVLRTSGPIGSLEDRRWVATFFGAAVIGAGCGATIATVLAGGMSAEFFISWFITVTLGLLIVTPIIVTVVRGYNDGLRAISPKRARLAAIVFSIVTLLAFTVFQLAPYPLLFLPLISVIAATYLFGSSGAAISILIITVCGTFGQMGGTGPTQSFAGGWVDETLFFQFYQLSLLLAAWPLAALLSEKRSLIADYAESNSLLEMAESAAHLGHWYFDADGTGLTWSNEVSRIHGIDRRNIDPRDLEALEIRKALDLYHPDDCDNVRQVLRSALRERSGFSYTARIVRPNGVVRYITSIGEPTFSQSGHFTGLFGTLQDVTEQTQMLADLHKARETAEHEAANSKRLAETDQLTGLANRRKVLSILTRQFTAAKKDGQPLTIAIFDVDHFKTVNDRFGHQSGDEVLKGISAIAERSLRSRDTVGRLGGEEFLAILPGEAGSNAESIVERLRLSIARADWPIAGLDQVTVSIGLATYTNGQSIEDLMRTADDVLYQAKNDGRNLLRIAA